MATTTLPLYWNLSSAHAAERIDASVKLVSALEQFQEQFVANLPDHSAAGNGENQADSADAHMKHLDASNAADVSYAIKRLIRGLASPRDSSRQGFAVALTELLSKIDTVSCQQILAIVVNNSQTSGSMTGQEERDNLFARLFGIKAIIQSGLLVKQTPLRTSSAAPTSLQCFELVLSELMFLGEKKSWLRESCWWTMLSALETVNSSGVSWKDDAVKLILNRIYTEDKSWSPEKVALTLRLKTMNPSIEWNAYITSPFKGNDVLATSNLLALGRIMKELNVDETEEATTSKSQSGSWKPQLHYAWNIIMDALLQTDGSITETKFQDFYRIVVDETLFAASSSPERKYWGFQVFQSALHRLPPSQLSMLFTTNFMRTWINHLSKSDRYLHKIAKQVASDVQTVVANDPNAGLTLVLQLTGTNGSRQFDHVTKTKTVESILSNMNADGIASYTKYLLEQMNESGEREDNDVASMDSRRAWVTDQLVAILRNGAVPKDDQCIITILNWLMTHGFFEIVKKSSKASNQALHSICKPPFTDSLRKTCRTKLLNCLAELIDRTNAVETEKDAKKAKLAGVAADGEFWLSKLFKNFLELLRDSKHAKLVHEVDDEAKQLVLEAAETTEKLKNSKHKTNAFAQACEMLIAGVTFKCLVDDGEDEQCWALLQACIEAAKECGLQGQKKSKDHSTQAGVDIIVDNVIALLEHSSAYTRALANQTFALVTSEVKESTVDLILAQLERRDPTDEVEEDEEMDDDEGGSAEEDPSVNGAAGESDDEESDVDDTNDDDDDGAEVDDDAAVLREKLQAVFGDAEVGTDEDESSDDEASMDDEQMMQIDEKLAEVFKSRVDERKKGRDAGAQREATYFKNRVLDLVNCYMKREPKNELLLRLIAPLVDLISNTSSDERQLADKTNGILRSHMQKHKEKLSVTDTAAAAKTLQVLHEKARKASTPELLSTINLCSLFVARCLVGYDEQAIVQAYQGSIVDFATRKSSSLQPPFIIDFIRRMPNIAWETRSSLISTYEGAVNGFRRSQLFNFAQVLLSALPNDDSRKKEAREFISELSSKVLVAIQKSCGADKPFMSSTQMKETLKTALQVARLSRRILPEETPKIWNSKSWSDLAENLASSSHYKSSISLPSTCKQISQVVGGNTSKGTTGVKSATKRKVDVDVEGQENSNHSNSTKRKKARKQATTEFS